MPHKMNSVRYIRKVIVSSQDFLSEDGGDLVYCFDTEGKNFRLARVIWVKVKIITVQGDGEHLKQCTSPQVDFISHEEFEIITGTTFDYLCEFLGEPTSWCCVDGDQIRCANPDNVATFGDCSEDILDDLLSITSVAELGSSLFVRAARYGKTEVMTFLCFDRDVSPYEVDPETGLSALHLIAGRLCEDEVCAEKSLNWFLEYHIYFDDYFRAYCEWSTHINIDELFSDPGFRNPFHLAAQSGNIPFIRRLFDASSDVPFQFFNEPRLTSGSLSNCMRHLYDPLTPQEAILPFHLIDTPDDNGMRPIDCAVDEWTRSNINSHVTLFRRYRLSKLLNQSRDNCDGMNPSNLLSGLALTEEDARDVILNDPSLLRNVIFSKAVDFQIAMWILNVTKWDVCRPLRELTDKLGFSWNLGSLTDEAFGEMTSHFNNRALSKHKWNEYEQDRELLAVMMAAHPRLGAGSPLGRLPYALIKKIALFSISCSNLKALEFMLVEQDCFKGEVPNVEELHASYRGYTAFEERHISVRREFKDAAVALGWAKCKLKVSDGKSRYSTNEVVPVPLFLDWLVREKGIRFDKDAHWDRMMFSFNIEGLQWLIDTGQAPSLSASRSVEALRYAASSGSLRLFEWVVGQPVELPDSIFVEMLQIALEHRQHHICKRLERDEFVSFESFLPNGLLPSHMFIQNCVAGFGIIPKNYASCFIKLLKYYTHGSTASWEGRLARSNESIDWEKQDSNGRSLLSYALQSRNSAIVAAAQEYVHEQHVVACQDEALRQLGDFDACVALIDYTLRNEDSKHICAGLLVGPSMRLEGNWKRRLRQLKASHIDTSLEHPSWQRGALRILASDMLRHDISLPDYHHTEYFGHCATFISKFIDLAVKNGRLDVLKWIFREGNRSYEDLWHIFFLLPFNRHGITLHQKVECKQIKAWLDSIEICYELQCFFSFLEDVILAGNISVPVVSLFVERVLQRRLLNKDLFDICEVGFHKITSDHIINSVAEKDNWPLLSYLFRLRESYTRQPERKTDEKSTLMAVLWAAFSTGRICLLRHHMVIEPCHFLKDLTSAANLIFINSNSWSCYSLDATDPLYLGGENHDREKVMRKWRDEPSMRGVPTLRWAVEALPPMIPNDFNHPCVWQQFRGVVMAYGIKLIDVPTKKLKAAAVALLRVGAIYFDFILPPKKSLENEKSHILDPVIFNYLDSMLFDLFSQLKPAMHLVEPHIYWLFMSKFPCIEFTSLRYDSAESFKNLLQSRKNAAAALLNAIESGQPIESIASLSMGVDGLALAAARSTQGLGLLECVVVCERVDVLKWLAKCFLPALSFPEWGNLPRVALGGGHTAITKALVEDSLVDVVLSRRRSLRTIGKFVVCCGHRTNVGT